ncbi:MAG TPA: MMPL family transporter [Planctomycetota bacterium]|nr:MMPL family transporter [Planctomycetota bacterium]
MLSNLLSAYGRLAVRRRYRVLAAAILLALAAAPFALKALRNIDVNLFNQVSPDLKRVQLMREITQAFGGETLVAVARIPDEHSAQDVKELKDFALILASELEKVGTLDEDDAQLSPALRDEIAALRRLPLTDVRGAGAEALDEAPAAPAHPAWLRNVECRAGQNLSRALKALARQHPYALMEPSDVERLKKLFEPDALAARMERIAQEALDLPANSIEKTRLYEDPLGAVSIAEQALRERLKGLAPPWAQDADGFFLSPDGTTLIVLGRAVLPSSRLDFNRALMAAAQRAENRAVRAFRAAKPGLSVALKGDAYGELAAGETPGRLQVGFTGMPAVYVENERTLKSDMLINTGTSLLGVLILFLILYRSVTLTWNVTWTTVFTIWLTIAFAGLLRGSMSLLGGAFTAVPVGLGTDYAILVFNTFQDLREREKLSADEAMGRALAQCGPSILNAALITAIAFFGVGFTRLSGLAEFGILGGVSALIGSATMLLVLPAAIASRSAGFQPARAHGLSLGMPTLGRWLEKKSFRIAALAFSALLLIGGMLFIRFGPDPGPETVAGVRFDPELGNLRSVTNRAIPLRDWVTRRFHVGLADISVVVEAESEDAAFEGLQQLRERAKPFVERGELKPDLSVLDYIPSQQRQRETIAALKTLEIDAAIAAFQRAAEKRFGVTGAAKFKPFLRHLRDFKTLLADPHPVTLAELMDGPLGNLLAPYVSVAAPPAPMGMGAHSGGNEPPKGGTTNGTVRLRTSWLPKDANQTSAWYADVARALESESPRFSVKMTAAKMVGFELKDSTLHDCGWITLAVSIGVALSLIAALRSLTSCLLTLIPLVFAYLAMLVGVPLSQLLGWDYSLNFVNLIMFPLLLGSAVDYGVYMVFAFDRNRPRIGELMSRTGRSVLYCMGTTLIGFGSFVTSSYTGLLSMGVASLWGYAGATVGALLVLPAVLGVICERGK